MNINPILTLTISVIVVVVMVGAGNSVFAQTGGGTTPTTLSLPNPLAPCTDFNCILGKLIRGLRLLATPVVTLMVIVGGFQIMTSTGDPEKHKRGWKTVGYSVGGYAAILLAEGVHLILQDVLS